VAYKNEAFTLFQDMMNTIWSDFARMVYNVEVEVDAGNGDGALPSQPSRGGGPATLEYSGGALSDQPTPYGGEPYAAADVEEEPVQVAQRKLDANEQLGRNDPCWCGSGKKFKKCHGA
jgi:preprotein translocase subunit SecA